MRILIIDNYDSFTYNLVQLLREEGIEPTVIRNDKIQPEDCLVFDALVLSPGPGIPKNAGNLMSIIAHCAGKKPILGICLGHQAIAEHLGGELVNLKEVYHGVQAEIQLKNRDSALFDDIEAKLSVGRYHSWAVNPATINGRMQILASAEDGCIMAIQNDQQKLYGIQFHPESVMTPSGDVILRNFISMVQKEMQ